MSPALIAMALVWAGEPRHGAFGEVEVQLSPVDLSFGTIVGGGAGFVLWDRFVVGARGYGLAFVDRDYGDRELRIGWGGVDFGVIVLRTRRFATGIDWLLAGGRACLNKEDSVLCGRATDVFVSTIDASIDLLIRDAVRFGFAVGYRFVAGARWSGPGAASLSGSFIAIRLAAGRW